MGERRQPGGNEPLFVVARLASPAIVLILAVPVLSGLAGTLLPAFSYLPALGRNAVSLSAFHDLLAMPHLWRSAWLSMTTGLASTLLSTGLAAGIVAAAFGTRGWARMLRFLSPILSVPHAATAFGLMTLFMPSGLVARLMSPWATGWQTPPDILIPNDPWGLALIAGLVAKEVPFLLLILIAGLAQSDASRSLSMSSALGYGRMAGFMQTVWPQLYRQARFAVFAVLAFSATVVDVAVILGPTSPPTLSAELVQWMNDPDLSMRFTASAGAVLQLSLVLASFALWVGIERLLGAILWDMAIYGKRLAGDGLLVASLRATGWFMTAATLAGLALLAVWSVSGLWPFPDALPQNLSLRAWMQAMPSLAGPLTVTFITGAVSAMLATLLCIATLAAPAPAGWKPLLNLSLALPLIVPQTAFLFGLQIAAIHLNIGYGLGALIAVHLVFVLPYVFLSLSPAWAALDPRFGQLARGLGKSRTTTLLRIELPMLLRPVMTAFAVGFAVSAGLYLPTLLIGAGRLPTITTEAVALASGGNRRIIGVYAFLQAIVPFAGFLLAFAVPAWLFRNRAAMRAS